MSGSVQPPPRPRRTLRVGVTGHRDLVGADLRAVRAGVRDVLGRVRTALSAVTDAPGLDLETPPRLVLVSPLAAGADQLVADEAIRQGYELAVPLPCAEAAYVAGLEAPTSELREEARREYARLRPSAVSVLEVETAAAGPSTPDYETLGRLVVENSDLLLAVLHDRERDRAGAVEARPAPGGAADVARIARARDLPVIVLPVERPAESCLLVGEQAFASGSEPCQVGLDRLDEVIGVMLAPWARAAVAATPAHPHPSAEETEFHADQRAHLEDFVGEPAFRRLGRLRRFVAAQLVSTWTRFSRRVPPGEAPAPTSPRDALLAGHQAWAGALADHYMPLYRGGFVVAYGLGAAAVWMALISLIHMATHHMGGAWRLLGALAAVAPAFELFCLVAVILLVRWARRERWHERAIDYRILSELLRHTRRLAALGLAPPNTRPRAHLGGAVDLTLTWVVSHYRAVLREAGLPSGQLRRSDLLEERRRLADDWLGGQAAYHRAAAERHERMGRALHRRAQWLVRVALYCCVLHWGLHLLEKQWHRWDGAWALGALLVALTAMAAGLPAIAAAFHGIRGQAELERLAHRSEGMARRLDELRQRVLAIPEERVTLQELARHAQRASQAMVEELDDWQALSRGASIEAT